MLYDEEFLRKIMNMGILNYPAEKIINILELDDNDRINFLIDFDDPKSTLSKSYQKGIDKGDFILDQKLFEKAQEGDLKALQKYEERKKINIGKNEEERKDRIRLK